MYEYLLQYRKGEEELVRENIFRDKITEAITHAKSKIKKIGADKCHLYYNGGLNDYIIVKP